MRTRGIVMGSLLLAFIAAVAVSWIVFMTAMPGRSYRRTSPPLSPQELESAANLKKHVVYLADTIGERNVIAYQALESTRQYIEDFLSREGYQVRSQEYVVQMTKVRNLIVEIPGSTR